MSKTFKGVCKKNMKQMFFFLLAKDAGVKTQLKLKYFFIVRMFTVAEYFELERFYSFTFFENFCQIFTEMVSKQNFHNYSP